MTISKPRHIKNAIPPVPDYRWRFALIILLILLAVFYTFIAFHLGMGTYDGGPDEPTRYLLPLTISHGNLMPRGDDPSTIGPIGNYSYAYYPQLLGPYIQAFLIWLARMFGFDMVGQLIAARLCSVAFGVFGAYMVGRCVTSALQLSGPNKWEFLATTVIGFWPQYVFLSAYVNNDIIAISGVAVMLFGVIDGEQKGWKNSTALIVAAGITISALSYLNTYGYILVIILFFIISVWHQLYPNRRKALGLILTAAVFCMVTVLPFMIVCYLRYGDPTGASAFSAGYEKWVESTGVQTMLPYSGGLISLLTQSSFVPSLICSFVGTFGYMAVPIDMWKCALLLLPAVCLAVLYCIRVLRSDNFMLKLLVVALLVGSVLTVALVIWRTLKVDYQAQGRYIISIFVPLCVGATLEFEALVCHVKEAGRTVLILCIATALVTISVGSFYDAATKYTWMGPTSADMEKAMPEIDSQ